MFTEEEVGSEIRQDVDVPTRELHSRLHTGGHVLGLAISMLSREGKAGVPGGLKDGKASHYPGMACVESVGLIPGEAKAAIQERVDELVGGGSCCEFLSSWVGRGCWLMGCRLRYISGARRKRRRSVLVVWKVRRWQKVKRLEWWILGGWEAIPVEGRM